MNPNFSFSSSFSFKRLAALVLILSSFISEISQAQALAIYETSAPAKESDAKTKWQNFKISGALDLVYVQLKSNNASSYGLMRLDVTREDELPWFPISNVSFFGDFMITTGGRPSSAVGDLQVADNIEAPTSTFKFMSLGIKKDFVPLGLSFSIGLMDLNAEFYVTDASASFLNSSFGVGHELAQSTINGPSIFPSPSLALLSKMSFRSHAYLKVGIFDAVPDETDEIRFNKVVLKSEEGFLLSTEGGVELESSFKAGVGFWRYSQTFPDLTDVDANQVPEKRTNSGFYLLGEKRWTPRMSTFVRWGFASPNVHPTQTNFSMGGTLQDPFSIPNTELGLGASLILSTNKFRSTLNSEGVPSAAQESVYEVFYTYSINQTLSLRPDFQYLTNPGYNTASASAWVGSVRAILDFN